MPSRCALLGSRGASAILSLSPAPRVHLRAIPAQLGGCVRSGPEGNAFCLGVFSESVVFYSEERNSGVRLWDWFTWSRTIAFTSSRLASL